MSAAPRRYVERLIARRLIADLLRANYSISVNDGEETTVARSVHAQRIFAAMCTTDEDSLIIYRTVSRTERFGWIKIVYGNDGVDMISDYTTNLEPIIAPIYQMDRRAHRPHRVEYPIRRSRLTPHGSFAASNPQGDHDNDPD